MIPTFHVPYRGLVLLAGSLFAAGCSLTTSHDGPRLDAAAVAEACDLVERWSVRNPPGTATQDSWLAYVATFTWPVVVDVPLRRDEAAKALARIDELLTAPAK